MEYFIFVGMSFTFHRPHSPDSQFSHTARSSYCLVQPQLQQNVCSNKTLTLQQSQRKEKQSVLKVTYNLESYLVKVVIVLSQCMGGCVFLYMCICMCVCLVNTTMQPFLATAECSKTIKALTEVLTVDYSGCIPKPGIWGSVPQKCLHT